MKNMILSSIIETVAFWSGVIVLLVALYQLQKAFINQLMRLGGRWLVLLPAAFCVPVHELSHLIVAIMCGHSIKKVAFFAPNGSTLGFVEHTYNKSLVSPFTNMLIGMAPLLGGALVVYFFTLILFPEILTVGLEGGMAGIFQKMIIHLDQWEFWTWLIVTSCLSCFCVPSKTDFAGAKWGILLSTAAYLAAVILWGSVVNHTVMDFALPALPILMMSTLTMAVIVILLFIVNKSRGQ